jgi:hypothetical protein
MVDGMEIIPQATEGVGVCEACLQGKQNHEPIPKKSDTRASEILYRIHSDLCNVGDSREGYRYFATFIDDFSCYTKVVPLKCKDETLNAFKKFVACTENKTGKHVKHFRTDGGGEFYSKEFSAFCNEKGIIQEKTNPDTPQQNGITECKNQMLNNKACSMLAAAGLSPKLWVLAILHANLITNYSPTKAQWTKHHMRYTITKNPCSTCYANMVAKHGFKFLKSIMPNLNTSQLNANFWVLLKERKPSYSMINLVIVLFNLVTSNLMKAQAGSALCSKTTMTTTTSFGFWIKRGWQMMVMRRMLQGMTWVPRMRIAPPHHPIHLPLPLPLHLDVQVMSDGPLPQMTCQNSL